MNLCFDADRELDRRRRELLAQAARHRDRCGERIAAAAVAASRDHPLLYLLSGVGLGATAVVAAEPASRSLRTISGTLSRIAGTGIRFVARTLFRVVTRSGGGRLG